MAKTGPKGPRKTQEQRDKAHDFLERLLWEWKGKDLRSRSKLTNFDIATQIGIAGPTFSHWISGHRVPNEESALMIAQFFEAEPKDVFDAFGLEYKPIPTYEEVYKLTKQAIEDHKEERETDDDWSIEAMSIPGEKPINHEWILERLSRYLDSDYDMYEDYRTIADVILQQNVSLRTKALLLSSCTQFDDQHRINYPEDYQS